MDRDITEAFVETRPNPGVEAANKASGGRSRSTVADLNDLEVFARVVEESGFSRAARILGVPTFTVSRRVARLETDLGVRLLQRTTRQLSLTDVGRAYYEHVNSALREIESAESSLRNIAGKASGRVRVSTLNDPFIDSIFTDVGRRNYSESIEFVLSM